MLKLQHGASIPFCLLVCLSVCRSACMSVGLSFCGKQILTTSVAPWKLIFGMQPAFYLTKRNIEKKIGKFLRSSSKSKFKVFFIVITTIKQARSMQLDFNQTRRNIEEHF